MRTDSRVITRPAAGFISMCMRGTLHATLGVCYHDP